MKNTTMPSIHCANYITFAQHKGGAGKTTSCPNLGDWAIPSLRTDPKSIELSIPDLLFSYKKIKRSSEQILVQGEFSDE